MNTKDIRDIVIGIVERTDGRTGDDAPATSGVLIDQLALAIALSGSDVTKKGRRTLTLKSFCQDEAASYRVAARAVLGVLSL